MDTAICLEQEEKRRNTLRDDLPNYLIGTETEDKEFIEYIKNFKNKEGLQILELLKKYNDKEIIIIKNKNDINKLLEE